MKNTTRRKSEDGHARFKRVATKRTQGVLNTLRILGHCSNRSVYKYSDGDVRKIFGVVEEQVRIVKAKFKSPRRNFKL